MESRIPEHHPLRRLFGTLAERAFTEKLGWPDCNVSDYISKLLVEFIKTGKRSYRHVAEYIQGASSSAKAEPTPPLFLKLSENFELCVVGLGYIRGDLDQMQHSRYQQARRILLN